MLRRVCVRNALAPSRSAALLRATAARTAVRRLATAPTAAASARTAGRGRATAWAALALAGAAGAYALATRRKSSCDGAGASGTRKQYALSEVARHRSKADGIWVTYRDGVYDVTEWAELHPGGREKILLAAGGAIDPFWAMYQQHNTAQVKEILEKYRIGDVAEADRKAQPVVVGDPYANDPTDRHPALTVLTQKPFNAEPPAELLAASYITPTEFYFKRNHLPVPVTAAGAAQAAADWRLTVKGEGMVTRTLSLDDLARLFPRHTVTVTTQCAGNRRAELNPIKPVKGLAWGVGAISTAAWTGVRLRDVLAYAGLNGYDASVQAGVKHVQFEGTDTDPTTGTRYGASIPVHKALDERGDVLLAFEMNGKPIPLDHGYPLRVIVPGVVGARHVKWVNTIVGSPAESLSHWQQNDYKSFSPAVDWDSVDWKSAPAIQELPVQSAICEPKPGTTVDADADVTVKGYAWSGGGRGIARVDVSADGGKTWSVATLSGEANAQASGRAWAWYPWTATVTVRGNGTGSSGTGSTELICKAVDTAYNNQPDTVAPVYNLRGVANNAWHRVRLNIAAPTPASSAGAASA